MTPIAKNLSLLVLLAVALAACSDQPPPTGPGSGAAPPVEAALTSPTTRSIVLETNDLGSIGQGMSQAIEAKAPINELGVAAGVFAEGTNPYSFVWLNGRLQGLGPDGGMHSSMLTRPMDVTNANLVVGSMPGTRSNGLPTNWFPMVWQNGVYRQLQLPDSVDGVLVHGAIVYGSNDVGRGVGKLVFENSASPARATMWNLATGEIQVLGTLGGVAARAVDINNGGDIVANRQNTSGAQSAVIVQGTYPNLSVEALGDLGGHYSEAVAINELGQIVGLASKEGGRLVPFIWNRRTGMKELSLGSYMDGAVNGINDLGQAVGWVSDSSGYRHAAVWQDGEIYPLGDHGGLVAAYDINDDGQVVGQAYDAATFSYHAMIWRVPLGTTIDVSPGDASNSIALGSKGTVTVAVLTTPYFDAPRVVPTSLTLGNDDLNEAPVLRKRDGTPSVVLKDVDRDGDQDLVAQFDKDVLKQKGDLTATTRRLVLRGQLQNGKQIRGSNAVTVTR